ncbi:MAG: hypothetical protein ACRCW0_02815, partial [Clostridium sp.]
VKPNNNKRNFVSLIFIFYIMFNFLINYKYSELSSLILSIFFVGSIIFTYRTIDEEKFNKYIRIYISIVTVLSIYGIYQFIGRINGWAFSDLYIEGHMIQGFNWTNPIWLNGNVFYRVNSIYREPSFYSQFTALGIIFIFAQIKKDKKINSKNICFIIINLLGMCLSFSGTGFLILIPFFIYYFFIEDASFSKITKNLIIMIFLFIILIIILHIVNADNTIIEYFISRISEVTNNTGSGGIRFISAFENMKTVLEAKPLFGYGIGSRDIIFNNFSMNIKQVDSTLPRIGMELGVLGLVFWILFLMTYFDKNNMKNKFYKYIVFFLIIQLFNGDYFLQITNWIFLYFINCKIVTK